MDYLQTNPLEGIGNFKNNSIIQKEMSFYTGDEFKKFINAVKQCAINAEKENNLYEWNFYVFFSIAFYTGLRKGEIHALQWNDLDSDFNYLSVKRSINQKVKGIDIETSPKNNSSYRTLQIPTPLKNILNDHFKRCNNIDGFTKSHRICGGTTPLRDTTIQNRNKTYSNLANVKTIRIHDYRHSHSSLLANSGINIQEIVRRLGHAKIEITWNTYSHLYPHEEEKAIQFLNEVV
jgi:Integrase